MRQGVVVFLISLPISLMLGCSGSMNVSSAPSPAVVKVSAVQSAATGTTSSSSIRAGDTKQFVAEVTAGSSPAVTWAVDGVPGGNATVGTIDSQGLYAAPAAPPAPNSVTISATAAADTKASGAISQEILNPVPSIQSVTADTSSLPATLNIVGQNFVPGAQAIVAGTTLDAAFISKTQLQVKSFAANPAAQSITVVVSNPAPGPANSQTFTLSFTRVVRESRGSFSVPAARLLDQTTFGPTAADIAHINALEAQNPGLGMSMYIDEQMNTAVTPRTVWPASFNGPFTFTNAQNQVLTICNASMNCVQNLWFENALTKPDQLRQRAAFALSQIWVISGGTIPQSDAYLPFMNILSARAFDNYFNLMNDITLSSAMGYYLDMGNSAKAVPGQIPNENYARELMQLFTLGLYLLNDDGTYQLDVNGQPIPTYTEFDVQELAKALTGWTYQTKVGNPTFGQSFNSGSTDRGRPMFAIDAQHDMTAKGYLCPPNQQCRSANQTAQQDLTLALTAIFNHPNLPPFISKQLIQHLVTSNPSPAYVARIAGVFKDDGTVNHVRGNLAAVIKAVLLDSEARQGDAYLLQNGDGHLREPVLYITGVLRGLNFSQTLNQITYTNGSGQTLTNFAAGLAGVASNVGQNVLFSPSVFNYFPPDYIVPGTTFLGPEYQLMTSATAPLRANFIDNITGNFFGGSGIDVSPAISSYAAMAPNPDTLVDALGQTFLHGQMTPGLKRSIVGAVTSLPANATASDKAKTALYLILTSSEYQVIR